VKKKKKSAFRGMDKKLQMSGHTIVTYGNSKFKQLLISTTVHHHCLTPILQQDEPGEPKK
jgi:hypothetical protein